MTKNLDVEVRPDAGDGRGKGVFATRSVTGEDSLIFQERPLVAIQHVETTGYAVVCSHCFCMVGSIEHQLANAWDHLQGRPGAAEGRSPLDGPLPKLPCSEEFPLPAILPCSGRPTCDHVYCSRECEQACWASNHSLLCPSTRGSSTTHAPVEDPFFDEFYDHANATNDVFKLASQAVAGVLLSSQRMLEKKGLTVDSATPKDAWEALKEAWIPYSMGHKALWWEAVALPLDVPSDEEPQFRSDLKELAEDSWTLLVAALQNRAPELCATFPAVLQFPVWGSLIGMFELNNLNLVVGSPVPAWAQTVADTIEDIAPEERSVIDYYGAIEAYGGIDGLVEGEDEWAAVGNAFYSLQACLNHSCVPNAHAFKRDEDINGNGKERIR